MGTTQYLKCYIHLGWNLCKIGKRHQFSSNKLIYNNYILIYYQSKISFSKLINCPYILNYSAVILYCLKLIINILWKDNMPNVKISRAFHGLNSMDMSD